MSNLIPYSDPDGGGGLTRVPRSAKKALEQVHGHGLVAAAKVEAAAFVAHISLQETGSLSMEEAMLSQQCPNAAGRAKLIVDSFAIGAANTVSRMGYR